MLRSRRPPERAVAHSLRSATALPRCEQGANPRASPCSAFCRCLWIKADITTVRYPTMALKLVATPVTRRPAWLTALLPKEPGSSVPSTPQPLRRRAVDQRLIVSTGSDLRRPAQRHRNHADRLVATRLVWTQVGGTTMLGMLWRVGHKDDPAGFSPRELTSWRNRWDDPQREFRTSYAAETVGTALVEVFQHYRPHGPSSDHARRAIPKLIPVPKR